MHAVIAREAVAVGGVENVVLLGESQGACVALDAALTYPFDVGGVFVSYGQLYSKSPVPKERSALRVGAFVGSGDTTIGPQLALRSYCRLLESGYVRISNCPFLPPSASWDVHLTAPLCFPLCFLSTG